MELNYKRLLELKELIESNSASPKEKEEYVRLLYVNGNLTKKQYLEYLKNDDNDVINAALTIGGLVLTGWLLSKLFN